MKVHEKRNHSTQIENLNNEVKINQINNKEIEIEEETIYYDKKLAHMATIKDHMKSVIFKNKTEQYINDLSKIIKDLKKFEPPRRRVSDWLSD